MIEDNKKTALFLEHQKLNAKMTPFGGWLMPLQYQGIIKEHAATRKDAGVFDVSHMGQIIVRGKDSRAFLESVVPQKIASISPNKALYCHLTNDKGGVEDDLIIYNSNGVVEKSDYFIIANASQIEGDYSFLVNNSKNFDVEIINKSNDYSMIALQGPKSKFIIEKMGLNLNNQPKFFTFINTKLDSLPVLLSRTGYTGEDGFEIICSNDSVVSLWNKIISYGALPVGLGARDTLRLEAGLPLYGHELNNTSTPLESSLGFFIPADKKENYLGKEIIIGQKTKKVPLRKKLFPYVMIDRQIARSGYEVYIDNKKAGVVTSGTQSPTLGKAIGFCSIDFSNLDPSLVAKLNNSKESVDIPLEIMVRNKLYNAKITKKPFVSKNYVK